MEKTYEPQAIEAHWQQHWAELGLYAPREGQSSYCIMLPPPNVTGTLHMGHGFQHTLMDALIRRHTMQGDSTLWQPGTDHAGIATQMVVERELAKEQTTRKELGRDAFVERVWQWREQSGSMITEQIAKMGNAIDWERTHFSMDESITKATYTAFIKLYEQGLIYKGKRLVNWDPKLNTAISDLEVINKPSKGHLWHIRYPLVASDESVVIATTRPETLLGDTAVAVHPEDERYQHLVGKQIALPLTDRLITIITDEHVDREFGTGCVKITPAHDFNDYEVGQRHQLEMLNILTFDGHINNNAPAAYQGMERFAARRQVVKDLEAQGLLVAVENHDLSVPYGDRSDVVIEPMLTDQWYVKATELAGPAMDAVHNGQIEFVPANWQKTYLQWLENIQDWCISRQLWWGHRIPVWYDQEGNPYVGENEADARTRAGLAADVILRQDEDVLDTWFTAGLWPFSSLGWPEKSADLSRYYPSDVLVTGFDIIFFWVARMVMMGLHFMGDVPFKKVYITGLIRDAHGQKMSKSKGNVLDPIDLVEGIDLEELIVKRCRGLMQPQMQQKVAKNTTAEFPEGIASYGTDALRFTFCSLATTGRDIIFDMGRLDGYRNFCNKIWNAARFVLMQTEEKTIAAGEGTLTDAWIYSRLQQLISETNKAYANYRFDLIAQFLYEFIWNDYCDWYLEFSKTTLNDASVDESVKQSIRYTLLDVLETVLRLLHPIMPYISEEIWQRVAPLLNREGGCLLQQAYPQADEAKIDDKALQQVAWLQKVIAAMRNVRSEMNVSPAKKVDLICVGGSEQDQQWFNQQLSLIQALAKVDSVSWHSDELPVCAVAVVGDLEMHIPLAGLIDKQAEMGRLQKTIQKLQQDYDKSKRKLENPNYVKKAPSEVVAKEQQKLQEAAQTLKKLQEQYHRIEVI